MVTSMLVRQPWLYEQDYKYLNLHYSHESLALQSNRSTQVCSLPVPNSIIVRFPVLETIFMSLKKGEVGRGCEYVTDCGDKNKDQCPQAYV